MSRLVDGGDPALIDVDGSRLDPGIYGGLEGNEWDMDGDGWVDYFWPGTIEEAPEGFDPGGFDADDRDPEVFPGL